MLSIVQKQLSILTYSYRGSLTLNLKIIKVEFPAQFGKAKPKYPENNCGFPTTLTTYEYKIHKYIGSNYTPNNRPIRI